MSEQNLDPKSQSEEAPSEASEETQSPAPAMDSEAQAAATAEGEMQAGEGGQPDQAPDADEAEAPEGQEAQEAALPAYGVAVEDAGTLKKKVTITVPAARIDAKREEMFGELDRTAQVPGFRIGRAPRRLIEKRFGREVGRDIRNALVGESLGEAVKQASLHTVGEPDLDLEAIELPEQGDLVYSLVVEVAPEFELPELKGIEVTRPVLEVDEQRVDDAIERMRLAQAQYELTDEPVRPQDTVRVAARISGEGIEEHSAVVTLRVAPGQVEGLPLLDLGEKLAGRKVGETAELAVKVPDVHPTEAWRGKEAKVSLTIEESRRRILPEVNDQFAARQGFDSLEELRSGTARRMKAQIDAEVRRAMREQVREYLLTRTVFDLPPEAAARNAARVLSRRFVDLLQQGLPREQIEEHLTEIQTRVTQEADRDLKLTFILQRIAEDREIQVTEEEINAGVAQMARVYGRRPERLRQELEDQDALTQVAVAIQEDKVISALLADAKIVERREGEGEEAGQPAAQEQGSGLAADGEEAAGGADQKAGGGDDARAEE